MAKGSLVKFGENPPYKGCDPKTATIAVEKACSVALEQVEKISSNTNKPTWDNVMTSLDVAMERIDREYSLVAHLSAVDASPEWDEANSKCISAVSSASAQIYQQGAIYKRMKLLQKSGCTKARERILDEQIAEFELSGVGLSKKSRKIFADNSERLSQLDAQFELNIREATAVWEEKVTDESTLATMPPDMRSTFADGKGNWKFSLLDPSYIAYMTHGTDRDLRRRMCQARNSRASNIEGKKFDNTPLMKEILALRWAQAMQLGFPDSASMILSRRMAKDPGTVATFLEKLAALSKNAAQLEFAKVSKFADEDHGIGKLEAWDMQFVTEKFRKQETGLSDADIRPYFSSTKVLEGMYQCVGELFGIKLRPNDMMPVWEKSVKCLDVLDAKNKKIGTLYLDLEARSTKRGGAWAHGALTRAKIAGVQQLPVALINCNFSKAQRGGDSRLSWLEVVTLFHEAGHAFHHLLSRVDDYCASGMNGVEWDAVELPSQFLENFAWRKQFAIGMSSHAETGKQMPDSVFNKLQNQRTFLSALHVTRQLSFSMFDLEIHRHKKADALKIWPQIRDKYSVVPHIDRDRFPCSFSHIFAGGYASSYYGYLWAEVLAADVYEMFTESDANLAKLGKDFMVEVLERGGTRDAGDNFRALRGRDPDPSALVRSLGLA